MAQDKIQVTKAAVKVAKVDTSLGLVIGFAIVCKVDGEDYYDLGSIDEESGEAYSDHISEAEMLTAVTDFMKSERIAKSMHAGDPVGTIVHSFPLTTDIAKALGIVTKQTGWLVAMAPDADTLAKYESGEFTGFSIGGAAHREAEAA